MDSTILRERISRLIRDHFPFAFCPACAAKKLGVSAFDVRNAAQMLSMEADFAITRCVCYGCGSTGDLLGLTSGASALPDAPMEDDVVRPLIRRKMAEGHLPRTLLPRLWGGTGIEGVCAACDGAISKHQVALTGLDVGMTTEPRFHVRCFRLWEAERRKHQ